MPSEAARRRAAAFTLVEVMLAVGVFTAGVVVVLALLGTLVRAPREVAEVESLARLVPALEGEWRRRGFEGVRSLLKTPAVLRAEDRDPTYDAQADDRLLIWSREGEPLSPLAPVAGQPERRFFEIALVRDETRSPSAADGSAGFLAFSARVRWPVCQENGQRVPRDAQRSALVSFAVSR